MSLHARNWVWEHSRSKGTARLVLLAIAEKASGADCSAYAGTTMLIQRANAARSSVRQAVDDLIELGELAIVADRVGPRGETVYRLRLVPAQEAQRFSTGGPESSPGQNPARAENRSGGGPKSGPEGTDIRPGAGPESGPHKRENGSNRREKREGARASTPSRPARPQAPALSLITPDWQPSTTDVQAAQAARVSAGQPTLTGAQLADVTRKFVRRQAADSRRAPAAAWGARWQEWAERERPPEHIQAPLLFGLGGIPDELRWPHEREPQATEFGGNHPGFRPTPMQTCPGCERGFRAAEPGLCRDCRRTNTATG